MNILKLLVKCYRLAIVSNHPPGLKQWLKEWEIDRLFEVVVCSGDEGVAKPDPAPFILTLDRMGVTAAEAVFIDDTEEHVAAARSLGLHGMHFTTAEKLRFDLENLGLLGEDADLCYILSQAYLPLIVSIDILHISFYIST